MDVNLHGAGGGLKTGYENGLVRNNEKPFYLILNLAIGGAWGGQKGLDTAAFPQRMEVDYVRVYQKAGG